MAHQIEAAKSGRSTCVTCGEVIAKGQVRVAEEYQDSKLGAYRPVGRNERIDRDQVLEARALPGAT